MSRVASKQDLLAAAQAGAEWIRQDLEAAETGAVLGPSVELHRTIEAATRALRTLERPSAA
jgi:hypothetical protein